MSMEGRFVTNNWKAVNTKVLENKKCWRATLNMSTQYLLSRYTCVHTVLTKQTHVHTVPTEQTYVHTVPTEQTHVHTVPTEQIYVHTVPTEQTYVHTVPTEQTYMHTVPTEQTHVHTVPTEQTCPHSTYCADICAHSTYCENIYVHIVSILRTSVHTVPAEQTSVHTVPAEQTSVHTVVTAQTCLCNSHDLDIIQDVLLEITSWDFFIIFNYHDCKNYRMDTNIFYCNILHRMQVLKAKPALYIFNLHFLIITPPLFTTTTITSFPVVSLFCRLTWFVYEIFTALLIPRPFTLAAIGTHSHQPFSAERLPSIYYHWDHPRCRVSSNLNVRRCDLKGNSATVMILTV